MHQDSLLQLSTKIAKMFLCFCVTLSVILRTHFDVIKNNTGVSVIGAKIQWRNRLTQKPSATGLIKQLLNDGLSKFKSPLQNCKHFFHGLVEFGHDNNNKNGKYL